MTDLLRHEVSDRTNSETEMLLGELQLKNSSGATLANAIYEVIDDW